jgi:hypothetical protein
MAIILQADLTVLWQISNELCCVLQNMQVLEEEKSKLDAFCEQSLKTVSFLNLLVRTWNLGSALQCRKSFVENMTDGGRAKSKINPVPTNRT